MSLSIVLPGWPEPRSPLTGNGRRRSHWRVIHRAQEDLYYLMFSQVSGNPGIDKLPSFQRARVSFTYVFPDDRRHDWDNCAAACKAPIDNLRRLKIIEDDDDKHLQVSVNLVVEKGVRETRIEVSEWE